MVYLWTEDSKAGYHFWELLNESVFNNAFVVETKYGNENIIDCLKKLSKEELCSNKYVIAFDTVFDNVDIYNKFLELCELKSKNPESVFVLSVLYFEYLILQFEHLEEWTGSHKQKLYQIRRHLLKCIHGHRIDRCAIEDKATLKYISNFNSDRSSEFIIKAITKDLTSIDYWQIDSDTLGSCWWKDCCIASYENTKCGKHPQMGVDKLNELFSSDEIRKVCEVLFTILMNNKAESTPTPMTF